MGHSAFFLVLEWFAEEEWIDRAGFKQSAGQRLLLSWLFRKETKIA